MMWAKMRSIVSMTGIEKPFSPLGPLLIALAIGGAGLVGMLALSRWTRKAPEGLKLKAPDAERPKAWADKLLALVLAVAAVYALQRVWPQARISWYFAAFIAYEFFSSVLAAIKRREPKPSDPIGPGAPSRFDLRRSVGPVLWAVAMFALMRPDWLLDKLKWHWWFPLVFLLPFALFVGNLLCTWLLDRAVAQGHYDAALRLARFLFRGAGGAQFVRGDILVTAGRYAEAEAVLREGLAVVRNPIDRMMLLEDLGHVLLEAGKYGEAQRSYESARELMPKRSVPDRSLAELLLRQGIEPEQALELANRALELYRGSPHERLTCRERLGETLSVHAWALAVRGRSAEAIEAIEQALKTPARKSRPALAHVRFNAGMAMRALGNRSAANEHFHRGAEWDPSGRWGKLCANPPRSTKPASVSS